MIQVSSHLTFFFACVIAKVIWYYFRFFMYLQEICVIVILYSIHLLHMENQIKNNKLTGIWHVYGFGFGLIWRYFCSYGNSICFMCEKAPKKTVYGIDCWYDKGNFFWRNAWIFLIELLSHQKNGMIVESDNSLENERFN